MQLISTKQAWEDILKNTKCTNCTIEHVHVFEFLHDTDCDD